MKISSFEASLMKNIKFYMGIFVSFDCLLKGFAVWGLKDEDRKL